MIRLVSAIILTIALITPSWVIAASCADDPNECTPKNLCEMTTEVQGGQKVWTSKTEMSKHIIFAKQLGMDCGASDPKDPCDLDANECKISELCERATIDEDNKQWNLDNPDHVRLAKEYSLSCDVNDEKKIKEENTCKYDQPQNCNEEELCKRARRVNTETGVIKWGPENDVNVKEAKRRGLDCGVVEQNTKSISCKQIENLKTCSAEELCQLATKVKNGSTIWINKYSVYRLWAEERGLSCGVNTIESAVKSTTCSASSPEACETTQLCQLATTKANGIKEWVSPNSNFKKEAVKRGLICDVFQYDLKKYKRHNHEGKRAGEVSIGVIDRGWNGERFYSWPNGAALFLTNWKHDKSYNSNSNTNEVFPTLRSRFNQLPFSNRVQIQTNLKNKGMYNGSVDGLWGRNTLIGLVDYSSRKFFSINLNDNLLVDKVLRLSRFDTRKDTQPPIVEELNIVHKNLSTLKEIENKSSAFKSSFLNQSQLKRKQIQYALNKLGYYRSGIDGLWGNGTKNALTSFASAEGLGTSTPSTIFSKLLSKVSVPSSFAAPKQNKNKYAKNKKGNNQGLTPIVSNPSVSASQAIAICEPQAELAGRQAANSYRSPSYGSSANCRGYGYSVNCDIYENSGGFWGGVAEGLGQAFAGREAKDAVLKSCLAKYGWKK